MTAVGGLPVSRTNRTTRVHSRNLVGDAQPGVAQEQGEERRRHRAEQRQRRRQSEQRPDRGRERHRQRDQSVGGTAGDHEP